MLKTKKVRTLTKLPDSYNRKVPDASSTGCWGRRRRDSFRTSDHFSSVSSSNNNAFTSLLDEGKVYSVNEVKMEGSPITRDHINEFINNGVVVVPNVIKSDLIEDTLSKLRIYLSSTGCDSEDLTTTAGSLAKLSSTNGAGGILDIFYEDWKLSLNENPAVVSVLQELWRHTYALQGRDNESSHFEHPYGQFDPNQAFMYIDRVCYRVPSEISAKFGPSKKKQLQRSLTPHLDCCPHDMYGKDSKWRPIQAFLCLTDTLLPNEGGFEACPGHHKGFAAWAAARAPSVTKSGGEAAPCVGDFSPIRPIEDKDVLENFRHIPCKAGDLVCWVSSL